MLPKNAIRELETFSMQRVSITDVSVSSSNTLLAAASQDLQQEGDHISALPPEILAYIFEHLTALGLAHFSAVCRSWKQKVDDFRAWSILFKRDYPQAHQALFHYHQKHVSEAASLEEKTAVAWSQAYRT